MATQEFCMAEYEGQAGLNIDTSIMPPSVDKLFGELSRAITLDRAGVTIERIITPQEFAWITQDILSECTDLDEDQVRVMADAISKKAYVSLNYAGASVRQVSDFLAGVVEAIALHPDSVLGTAERQEILADAHWYLSTLTDAYERMRNDYSAGNANGRFVRRVVGAVAMHAERLEMPAFLNPNIETHTGSLLIGVTALRGAKYISRRQYSTLTNQVLAAKQVAMAAKPIDVMFVPPKWQNNL